MQVGGVGAAAQSIFLEFQLNARRNAVVDLHAALRSAGHAISPQYVMCQKPRGTHATGSQALPLVLLHILLELLATIKSGTMAFAEQRWLRPPVAHASLA